MTVSKTMLSPDHLAQALTVGGPKGWPILGHTAAFQRDRLGFITYMAAGYGEVSKYNLGHIPFYQINHPAGMQRVLIDNQHNYIKGTLFDLMRAILGNGLFTSEGALWLRQRRLMQPAFHRRRIAGFADMIVDQAQKMVDRWAVQAQNKRLINIEEEMTALTMTIITQTMFGSDIGPDIQRVSGAITTLLAEVNFRFELPFYPSLRWPTPRNRRTLAAIRTIDEVVLGIIDQRRQSGEQRDDLLGMLLEVCDEETGRGMTDQQLRDEVVIMFGAGHETTAVLLSWLFYLLDHHPAAEEQLENEIEAVLKGRRPVAADVPNLRQTRMIIDETLRLYPPVWISNREAIADDVVCGYHIPAGAVVGISPYVMHHLADFWPEPQRFDPARFDPAIDHNRPHFAYMPFGGGPHLCIGNNFALMEAALILAVVRQRGRLRLPAGVTVTPNPRATLRPSDNLLMRFMEI